MPYTRGRSETPVNMILLHGVGQSFQFEDQLIDIHSIGNDRVRTPGTLEFFVGEAVSKAVIQPLNLIPLSLIESREWGLGSVNGLH